MAKTTNAVVEAFLQGKKKKIKNDRTEDFKLYYHNNLIAYITSNENLYVNSCGWGHAPSTRERLSQIPNVHVTQKKGVLYLNGKEWDGKETKIN